MVSRKAEASAVNVIGGILIALVLIVSYFAIAERIGKIVPSAAEDAACLASVTAKAQTSFEASPVGRYSPGPFNCRTKLKNLGEIKQSKVSKIFAAKANEIQKTKQVKLEIARRIERCWWMMGQGRYSVTKDELTLHSDTQCFSCFDVGLPSEGIPDISGTKFETEYLVEQETSRKVTVDRDKSPEKIPVIDYITHSGGCGYLIVPKEFEKGRRYTITYVGDELPLFLAGYIADALGWAGEYTADNPLDAAQIAAVSGMGFIITAKLGPKLASKAWQAAKFGKLFTRGNLMLAAIAYGLEQVAEEGIAAYQDYTFNAFDSDIDKALALEDPALQTAAIKEAIDTFSANFKDCSGIWILPQVATPDSCYSFPTEDSE